jgi:hypothetical protein
MSELDLKTLVMDFASGMEKADAKCPQQVSSRTGKAYQPGLGPHTEAKTVDLVMLELQAIRPDTYQEHATGVPYPDVSPVRRCDLVVASWAVEAKMLRIMGDNGKPNDNMLMHILSPYPQHRSALTDCRKLGESSLGPRKAILIFGYEYEAWPMEPTITAFEVLAAREVALGSRESASVKNLVHPVHQQGAVFGWEILNVLG